METASCINSKRILERSRWFEDFISKKKRTCALVEVPILPPLNDSILNDFKNRSINLKKTGIRIFLRILGMRH